MAKEDIKKKILEDPDFIKSVKYGNSLNKFLARNTEDLKAKAIGKLLMMSEEEVEEIYQEAIDILRGNVLESEEE